MIGEVIAGIVEGAGILAEILCECIACAARSLAGGSDSGQRVSRRKVLLGFAPLVLFFVTIGGGIGNIVWQDAKRKQTRETVGRIVTEVAANRDAQGHVIKPNVPLPTDAWKQPLQVEIHRLGAVENVTVWSTGPDGKDATRDDISAREQIVVPREAARVAVRKIGNAIRRRLEDDS